MATASSTSSSTRAPLEDSTVRVRDEARDSIDVAALMSEIRERIKAEVATFRDAESPFRGVQPSLNGKQRTAEDLIRSKELRYLNESYGYAAHARPETIQSHRGGFIGRFIVAAKRRCMSFLWNSILRDYFERERDFQAHLVRFLNETTKHIAERDASIFWELIRKIDVDITRVIERVERGSSDQSAALYSMGRELRAELHRTAEELHARFSQFASSDAQREGRLCQVEDVAHGLEALVARLTRPPLASSQVAPVTDFDDQSYLLLENRFRGSEDEIRRRLHFYPQYFRSAVSPVLEIGAGRGELQQLFRDSGIGSYGIDMDGAMVSACREKELNVEQAEAIAHLRSRPARSLGGVIAVQVIEHLTHPQFTELLRLCAEKVVPGGVVVFETINPRSLLALSSNYFRDPTHVFPGHPDTVAYALELAGIRVKEVRMLSPVAKEALLQEITGDEFSTPRWQQAVEQVNRNIRQLNDLLYGWQDYAVIGEVRG